MAANTGWRKLLRESNAFGWIAFFILVTGIGVDTLFFGESGKAPKSQVEVTASAPD